MWQSFRNYGCLAETQAQEGVLATTWVFIWGKLPFLRCFGGGSSIFLFSLFLFCFSYFCCSLCFYGWTLGVRVQPCSSIFPVGHLESGCNCDPQFFQLDNWSPGATVILWLDTWSSGATYQLFQLDTWSSGATATFPVGHLEFGCNCDFLGWTLGVRVQPCSSAFPVGHLESGCNCDPSILPVGHLEFGCNCDSIIPVGHLEFGCNCDRYSLFLIFPPLLPFCLFSSSFLASVSRCSL